MHSLGWKSISRAPRVFLCVLLIDGSRVQLTLQVRHLKMLVMCGKALMMVGIT